jgi:hypothetical protein
MTELRKTQLTLPRSVEDAFAGLADGDLETRNLYAATLRRAGWTLQSISAATGITRERVRQVNENLPDVLPALPDNLPVPTPPAKAVRARKEYTEPDPAKLARLLELQPDAQKNRNNSTVEQRQIAEDYTALLWEVHDADGVPLYRLAKRLGVSHGALRFRLARYGYKMPQDGGVSKVYTRIDPARRVSAQ